MSKSELRLWIGNRVSDLIKSKGMTKRAISEKSGMPYSSLNSKLKGYRGFDVEDILALAEAIHEKPANLLPPQFHNPALAEEQES
ncbi:MAG: helix-turn-helix domain-containing protein [Bifidobacterium sp.]|jgi:transcriptional regulator with XRE-family HTH domain|nr:helix-turn-helix domain-containing protein [Bifidobacterium sp.]